MIRSRSVAWPLLLSFALAGCRFGMNYEADESDLTRQSVRIEDRPEHELSYLIAGDPARPRVIFIHGSPGSSTMYVDYLRELENEAEIIAVDRLGYGGSQASGVVV